MIKRTEATSESARLAEALRHVLQSINAALDKHSYGDSVEGDLLEAQATLDSLLADPASSLHMTKLDSE
jgi:hypothetical protein